MCTECHTSRSHPSHDSLTHSQDVGHFVMQKDVEREEELKSMSRAWEAEQPGRLQKVSQGSEVTHTEPGLVRNFTKSWT